MADDFSFTHPLYIDLLACSQELGQEKRYRKFKNLTKRLFDALSARLDLHSATAKMNVLRRMMPDADLDRTHPQPEVEAEVVASLFVSALILYARAIQTSSNHRGGVPIRDTYDSNQLMQHNALMSLRNDAVAHWGPGQTNSGLWANEFVSMELRGQNIVGFSHHYERAHVQPSTANDLISLLLYGAETIEEVIQKRTSELLNEISELCRSQFDFRGKILAHDFNPRSRLSVVDMPGHFYNPG